MVPLLEKSSVDTCELEMDPTNGSMILTLICYSFDETAGTDQSVFTRQRQVGFAYNSVPLDL